MQGRNAQKAGGCLVKGRKKCAGEVTGVQVEGKVEGERQMKQNSTSNLCVDYWLDFGDYCGDDRFKGVKENVTKASIAK